MAPMGLQFGLEQTGQYCKRENRWLFVIPLVSADTSPTANALPPLKSARPTLSFKEMDVNHLTEDVYFPCKGDWKPVTITLYDLNRSANPIFNWIQEVYQPNTGQFFAPNSGELIKQCSLVLLDAVGNTIERWVYEDAWPQTINFQTLDMGSSGVITCEITLRYARAYINN